MANMKFGKHQKFAPIKPTPPPENPPLEECVCGAVIPAEEVKGHRQICADWHELEATTGIHE